MANNPEIVTLLIDEAFEEAIRPRSGNLHFTLARQAIKAALTVDDENPELNLTTLDRDDAMDIYEGLLAIPSLMLDARGEEGFEGALAAEYMVNQLRDIPVFGAPFEIERHIPVLRR